MTSPINPYAHLANNRAVKYSNDAKAATSPSPEPATTTPNPDVTVHLSQTRQQISQQLATEPEINQNRVNQLKAQIDAGTYRISAERIADRLLESEQLI